MIAPHFLSLSFKGEDRIVNKDNTLVINGEDYYLAFVFDGVSSSASAKLAVDSAINYIIDSHSKYNTNNSYDLPALLTGANEYILRFAPIDSFTTCSAVCIYGQNQNVSISNIGDSRIYEVSHQFINLLTKDDSALGFKNILTKCLGMHGLKEKDFNLNSIGPRKNKILLCTDGFYTVLEKNKLLFHKKLNFRRSSDIKKSFNLLFKNKVSDDASCILIT